MDGKQFTVATLFAIILLVVIIVPMSTQQSGLYDPWLDYNEDGVIDVNELRPLGEAYGSSGNPAKNVTIAKHATELIRTAVGVSVPAGDHWSSGNIVVDGYAKVTILVWFSSLQNYLYVFASNIYGFSWLMDSASDFAYAFVRTYDVVNQRISLQVDNMGVSTAILNVDIYLVA